MPYPYLSIILFLKLPSPLEIQLPAKRRKNNSGRRLCRYPDEVGPEDGAHGAPLFDGHQCATGRIRGRDGQFSIGKGRGRNGTVAPKDIGCIRNISRNRHRPTLPGAFNQTGRDVEGNAAAGPQAEAVLGAVVYLGRRPRGYS